MLLCYPGSCKTINKVCYVLVFPFLQFHYSWVNLLALAISGNVFSWMHSDETIPRRSLANSLATYLHPPVWSSPMCLMVWLPSQRSQPQDRVETTGFIWINHSHIYMYITIYMYISWYIYIHTHTRIIAHTHTYIYTYICICIHTYTYVVYNQ